MNEITMIASALDAKQSLYHSQVGMAILDNRQKADQALAQMLMESVKGGQTVINKSGPGSLDLYV
jgi:hypothetical protein